MNKIYLTTDTHFGHQNIVEFCGRPDNHEELMANGFKDLCPEHTLIHLGDICMGNDQLHHEKYIMPLTCKKILVRGNHDRKSNSWYLDHGWDFVCRQFVDKYYGVKILFSHKPQVWDGEYDINIHGHFHNTDHRRKEPELNKVLTLKHILLALEYNNYRLYSLRDICEPIAALMSENNKEELCT